MEEKTTITFKYHTEVTPTDNPDYFLISVYLPNDKLLGAYLTHTDDITWLLTMINAGTIEW